MASQDGASLLETIDKLSDRDGLQGRARSRVKGRGRANEGGIAGEETDDGVLRATQSVTESRTKAWLQHKICCIREPCSLKVGKRNKRIYKV